MSHFTRRPVPMTTGILGLVIGLTLSTSACTVAANPILNPANGNSNADPGCIAALTAISTYGPEAVTFLANGREDVNKAVVNLLVIALDAAADAAEQPADKQAIRTLANVYIEFYDFTTNVVAVPSAALLKDTANLKSVCK